MVTENKPILLATGHPYGGILHFVAALAAALIAKGHRRCIGFAPASLLSRMREAHICQFHEYHVIHHTWGLNQWKFILQSSCYGLRFRRDYILHYHLPSFLPPDIYTAHGLYTRYWLQNPKPGLVARIQFILLSAIEKMTINRAKKVCFVSEEDLAYAIKWTGKNRQDAFTVINPGVNCMIYKPVCENERQAKRQELYPGIAWEARWLLFVGNDFGGKGLLRILGSMKQRTSSEEFHLLIFGTDSINQKKAEELSESIRSRVHFFKDDKKLIATFALCDILVMDSVAEGYPLVLLEAMASGCVPFTTHFGGVRESITHKKNGMVFQDADQLVEEALKINEEELAGMRIAARNLSLQRDWANVANDYEKIYRAFD